MDSLLQIRVSESFKRRLSRVARFRSKTLSDYTRDAISAQMVKDEKDMKRLMDSLEEEDPELEIACS